MSAPAASESPWAAGVKAARDNALPSLLILLAALALVVSYYQVPAVRAWLDVIEKNSAQFTSAPRGCF